MKLLKTIKKITLNLLLMFTLSFSLKAQLVIDSATVKNTCLDCDSIGVVPLPNAYGSLTIGVSGGISPYNFSLTGLHAANTTPLTTSSISGITGYYNSLCQDTFRLKVTDFVGDSIIYNFSTVPPPSPTVSIDSVTVLADSTNNPDSGVIKLHVTTTNADSVFYLIKDVGNTLNLGTIGGWQDSTTFDSLPGGYYYNVFVDIYPKITPSCGNTINSGTSFFQIYVPLACENDGFADFYLYPVCDGEVVQFLDLSYSGSGQGNTIVNWMWDFGDGDISTIQNPIHFFPQPGIYMVQLTITTSHGCNFMVSFPEEIKPLPTPAFNYSQNGSGLYTFTDLSSITFGTITGWSWNFGDGDTSTIQNPTHQYAATGNYTVCLTTQSAFGCTDTICQTISFAVGIDKFDRQKEVTLLPNPTSAFISILNTNYQEIKIFDVTGKQVKAVTTNEKNIDVRDLKKGIYFVKVKSNKNIYVLKFIKE